MVSGCMHLKDTMDLIIIAQLMNRFLHDNSVLCAQCPSEFSESFAPESNLILLGL